MSTSHHNRRGRAHALALGIALSAAALAACEGPADGAAPAPTSTPSPSMSPSPSASTAPDGAGGLAATASDSELRRHLGAFDSMVEIAGMDEPPGQRSPVDTAMGFYGSETAVVEPAACTAFHEAKGLGTPADLTVAAEDLINPVGPFFVDGMVPQGDEGGSVPFAWVLTRAFHDPALAAALSETLLAGDCDRYEVRTTWDEGSITEDITIGGVDEVMLPELDTPTVRIAYDGVTDAFYDAEGEQQGQGTRDPWTAYVHVHGPYAISVEVLGVDDEEAQVARVIAAFVDHMNAIG